MERLLQFHENNMRGAMQFTGTMVDMFSAAMSMNLFTLPFAEPVKQYGDFLKEKAAPISSRPWMTKNHEVYRWPRIVLRKFSDGVKGNPLLLVPPEAGHNSQIVDYGPGQSLVQCASENFSGDVYVMDKLRADLEHADYSIDDSIRSLDQCIRHIGQPVHLVGLCQGGWQSAIYSALFPERVTTLTLAGAPIDFHAGDGIIGQWVKALPISFFKSMVAMGSGRMPGAFITTGFKLMNAFDRFVGDDVNLYLNINDPEYLKRYRLFKQWYDFTQPIGGQMYLEVVEHLFKENKLVRGLLEVLGRKVDLSRIYQPLHLIAGTQDIITPPLQLFALRNHVSSEVIEEKLVEAGHIGVFMRQQVIDHIWAELFRKLSRSEIECASDPVFSFGNGPCGEMHFPSRKNDHPRTRRDLDQLLPDAASAFQAGGFSDDAGPVSAQAGSKPNAYPGHDGYAKSHRN